MFSGPSGEALGSDKAPVEVFSLGQFRILANGKPLRFGHKTPLKPLTLLKLIIALGGESVPVERISDALWPDSDGDRAQWAFSSALHRLRKLIGTDAVLLDGSRLTIDPGSCWVDCAAFARCLDLAREAANAKDFGEATRFSDVAASLYAGPFLQNEFEPSDLLIARERLDSRFLEHINLMGFFFSEAGQAARALPLYERGVEISPLDEDLHRRLMQAYLDSGRRSDAIATYRLLCSKLKGDGGREPSPQTRTLLSDLVDGQAVWAHEGKVAPNAEVLPGISEPDNKGTTPSLATPCLAVLPFKNITSDPQEDYFSAGLTDELITALSRISLLSVVSPNSLSSYRDGVVNLHRAVKELGVSHILEGSVRKSEARLRITAQLVKADTGQHVWAERYDRDFGDIFSVQDDITLRLVTALDVQILEGEQARLWRRSTHSSDAYDMFLRARSIWQGNLTRESCIEARQLLKDAIELDSEFVRAYPTLAVLDIYEAAWGREIRRAPRSALVAARRLTLGTEDRRPGCHMSIPSTDWPGGRL